MDGCRPPMLSFVICWSLVLSLWPSCPCLWETEICPSRNHFLLLSPWQALKSAGLNCCQHWHFLPQLRGLFSGEKRSKHKPEPRMTEKGWELAILQFSSCRDVPLISDMRLNPCLCPGSWHLRGQSARRLVACRYGTEVPVVGGEERSEVKDWTHWQHFVGSGGACLTQGVTGEV